MKLLLATILMGALLAGGCATKKYVRNKTAPIQAKTDQVGEQTTRNTQQIDDTRKQVTQVDQKAQSGISAAQERAATADQHAAAADKHAADAMNRANQAAQAGEEHARALNTLKQAVSNIDDYKLQTAMTVPFKLNQATLTPEAQQDLDKLVKDVQSNKRFYISVEGFTDSTGPKDYNQALSKRRADAVVNYLVAKHNISIYRIHMIGLGDAKPVDEAKNRSAREKNRRVEVRVFTADQVTSSLTGNTDQKSPGR